MGEFKVGDVVENISDGALDINVGERYTITGVDGSLIDFNDSAGHGRTRTSNGYKLHSRPSESPPATITHEGYTYTRGERVRPDWLKDGAWVVNVGTGDLRQVKEVSPGVFDLTTGTIISIRYGDHIRDQYRPHEPSDYKWGDWAMYDGKKVFVMCGPDQDNHIAISGTGMNNSLSNWKFVKPSELTPAHAP